MRVATLILVLCMAIPAHAEEPTPEQRAVLELDVERTAWFVGESPVVTLRVFVDREFFKESAVPLFRREMDLPIQVRAPWLRDTEPVTMAPGVASVRIAIGDKILPALRIPDREIDGRVFTGLAIQRRISEPAAGALVLASPELRFAYATEFDEGFLDERLPIDRNDVRVDAPPVTLSVAEPPTDGRPAGFRDAIGRFTLAVQPTQAELAVGDTLQITLTITGTGNLGGLTPPSLDGVAGLAVMGSTDSRGAEVGTREIVFEVSPTSALSEIPAFILVHLDPGPPAAYQTARSAPISLRVTGGGTAREPARPDPLATDEAPAAERDLTPVLLLLGGLLLVFLALLTWAVRFRRRVARDVPIVDHDHLRALREAAAKLRALGDTESVIELIATALRTTEPAVISPRLESMLRDAGVGAELAAETASVVEAHVAARYGGPASAAKPSGELVDALATRLDGSA